MLFSFHTLRFLTLALLFQLKRLSTLLTLSLARQERRLCVYSGCTISSGPWELICAAVLPLPWQKPDIFWFSLPGKNAAIQLGDTLEQIFILFLE